MGAGTFAEYSVASVATLARRPSAIDAPFGAALSLAGASALQMVDATGGVAGDVVLVIGATGGIALQLLRAEHTARHSTPSATCSSNDSRPSARSSAGAGHSVQRTGEPFNDRLRAFIDAV